MSEGAGISMNQVAQQATNENGETVFEKFSRQGEEEVCIRQLGQMERAVQKGSGGVRKRCQHVKAGK